ncbi:hypothetical protein M422DRAFT_247331 [Sphaerobolus stellatus SS14]|nr:hypothetical protein M422DRAFT_247331 [Sphaerobolus stellatus SS14]
MTDSLLGIPFSALLTTATSSWRTCCLKGSLFCDVVLVSLDLYSSLLQKTTSITAGQTRKHPSLYHSVAEVGPGYWKSMVPAGRNTGRATFPWSVVELWYLESTLSHSFKHPPNNKFILKMQLEEMSQLHTILLLPNSPSSLDLFYSLSSTQLTNQIIHFAAILAVAAVSAFAAPLTDTEVVAPVKGLVSATDVIADVDAAVGNVAVKGSDVADNIGNNNHVSVLPRDLVTVGALIEALANALAKADVSLKVVLANVDVQDSSIITGILNDNKITVLRRRDLILPANIDAIVLALINAAVAAGVNVQAAVANIGINYSTLLSNIGNNNVIFVRSLPETVDIAALVKAIADAAAAVGVDIKALIANIKIENSSILTDILNGNEISIGRRDLPIALITADVLAVLKAIVTAALDAQVDIFATALNAGLDSATILSNILNNNAITILPIFTRNTSALDIYSTVLALVQALIAVGVPVDIFALNTFIKNSNIGTNILNDNIIKILGI